MDYVAARTFNYLYIYFDIIWLIAYALILISHKRYIAFIAGLAGGVIYFAVDYGIFFLALHTRVITGADPFWLLLWLSMSYGFTNFAWIWLLLDRDGHGIEWSAMTIAGWVAIATLSQTLGGGFPVVTIQRATLSYHRIMAVILVAGYLYLFIRNWKTTTGNRVSLVWLLLIGIGVQFSWESVLVLSGIRPIGILPLIADSVVETNMGMPYLYLIHKAISGRFTSLNSPAHGK